MSAIPYDCTCADSTQLRPFAFGCAQRDRMRGRLQRVARLREPEPRVVDEVADRLRRARLGGIAASSCSRAVEPEHRELPPEEAAVAAVQDQLHEDEVRLDEHALQLAVQLVDERLHLLRHARRDRSACRCAARGSGSRPSSRASPTNPGGTVIVATTLPDASSRARLVRRSCARASRSSRPGRSIVCTWKRWPATTTGGHVVLVDERDARLRARVAGDEPDEQCDHDRVREQRPEQQRRPAQHESGPCAAGAARPRSSEDLLRRVEPTTTRPSRSTSTRSACSTSSRFCVAKQTAPPSPRSASTTSQTRRR